MDTEGALRNSLSLLRCDEPDSIDPCSQPKAMHEFCHFG